MGTLGFAHPGFLWLALFAALPPIIHLLGRRKPRRLVFPPFEFVRRLEERSRSRRKLRSILLLALRTLLLLLIPAALARPQLVDPGAAPGTQFDVAIVIVDNSLSAAQASGGETALDKIRRRASAIAAGATAAHRVLVVSAAQPPALLTPFPAASPALAREAVAQARQTYAATAIGGAIALARAAIDATPPASAKGHLLSDLSRHAFREAEDLSITLGGARVPWEIVDPVPAPEPNLAPVAALVRGSSVNVTVANHSRGAVKAGLKLRAGSKPQPDAALDVPARGTAEASFDIAADRAAGIVGEATLAPDALPLDNTLAFASPPGRETAVLIVDGDPRTMKYADEAFYLEKALKAGAAGEFSVSTTFPESIPDDLSRFDVVAVLNAGPLGAAPAARLESFVNAGGGLLLAAGDRTDPRAWNALAWLPAQLAAAPTAPSRQGLSPGVQGHPALAPFNAGDEGLGGVKVSKRFELVLNVGAAPILLAGDGRPLAAAGRHGDGRIIVYGSTLDRDWSDWPIRTSYLPAMRAFMKHLSRAQAAWAVEELRVGERRAVRVDACPATLASVPQVRDSAGMASSGAVPQGKAAPEVSCRDDGGVMTATIGAPAVPGLYALDAGGRRAAYVVVKTDPAESDLEKAPRAEVEAALGAARRSGLSALVGLGSEPGKGPPIWSWLLLLAALALGAEQWLTRRG